MGASLPFQAPPLSHECKNGFKNGTRVSNPLCISGSDVNKYDEEVAMFSD